MSDLDFTTKVAHALNVAMPAAILAKGAPLTESERLAVVRQVRETERRRESGVHRDAPVAEQRLDAAIARIVAAGRQGELTDAFRRAPEYTGGRSLTVEETADLAETILERPAVTGDLAAMTDKELGESLVSAVVSGRLGVPGLPGTKPRQHLLEESARVALPAERPAAAWEVDAIIESLAQRVPFGGQSLAESR